MKTPEMGPQGPEQEKEIDIEVDKELLEKWESLNEKVSLL